MGKQERYGVIIVGAGHNGMTTPACLAMREMHRRGPQSRSTRVRPWLLLLGVFAWTAVASEAHAQARFLYAGEPVHPACVHALAMHQGDAVPVTTAVSLEGCASSERSRSKIRYEGDIAVFEDEALLGGGSFGYRELAQLDNGIIGLAIRRVLPDGEERVSLAAVKMIARPMIRHGQIVRLEQIELLGELWVPDMQLMSFRSMGNIVHFSSGVGPEKVERTVDFTRIGRMRK
ncbi:MAG: hypothetical protein GWN09_08290 [Gammaproteobacteria bacterium]|nr:hypothetical protein [Gammaproteobacteria bacterium]